MNEFEYVMVLISIIMGIGIAHILLGFGGLIDRAYPEAQFIVRVEVTRIYPNCPRYIHKYELVERSSFVPRRSAVTPFPEWKQSDWARGVLPASDHGRRPL